MSSKSCLDTMSGSEVNERSVATDDPNGLASVVTQEIHTDNEAGDFGLA